MVEITTELANIWPADIVPKPANKMPNQPMSCQMSIEAQKVSSGGPTEILTPNISVSGVPRRCENMQIRSRGDLRAAAGDRNPE